MKADRDLIIIGGGAARLTAAQYAARANLNVLLLEEMATGGQSLIIDNLENYPGYPDPLPGIEFAQRFEQQALRCGAEIQTVGVSGVQVDGRLFRVQTDNGPVSCYAVILATGAKHKKLDVPGEAQFTGRGVSYCATCDGPFFKGKRMLVVGGGDAACDEAMFLSKLTEKVLMIHRRDRFRAQKALDKLQVEGDLQIGVGVEVGDLATGDGATVVFALGLALVTKFSTVLLVPLVLPAPRLPQLRVLEEDVERRPGADDEPSHPVAEAPLQEVVLRERRRRGQDRAARAEAGGLRLFHARRLRRVRGGAFK